MDNYEPVNEEEPFDQQQHTDMQKGNTGVQIRPKGKGKETVGRGRSDRPNPTPSCEVKEQQLLGYEKQLKEVRKKFPRVRRRVL